MVCRVHQCTLQSFFIVVEAFYLLRLARVPFYEDLILQPFALGHLLVTQPELHKANFVWLTPLFCNEAFAYKSCPSSITRCS
jgi:Na+-transporting methylmalonyl-CoA/oxaloacetate decarboxylase beta subunit